MNFSTIPISRESDCCIFALLSVYNLPTEQRVIWTQNESAIQNARRINIIGGQWSPDSGGRSGTCAEY